MTDPDDERVADYRAVSAPSLAEARGFFIAEGRFVVKRLLASSCRPRSLLLDPASLAALAPALAMLADGVPVYVAERRLFEALTGYDLHRGCLAIADRPPELSLDTLTARDGVLVVLEHCNNADNMGGVFRNVAAFGAVGVLLSPGSVDPLYRKSVRTSMGAVLVTPFVRAVSWPMVIEELKAQRFIVAALTPRPPAISLDVFAARPRPRRLALLVGAEGDGVSDAALRLADVHVRIPMTTAVDSLNLAVATGVALARLSDLAGL